MLSHAVAVDFPGCRQPASSCISRPVHSSARESSKHCEHSEHGKPNDCELSRHASLITHTPKAETTKYTKKKLLRDRVYFPVVINIRYHHVFMGPDDFNGYGYFPVRLYWTEAGFQAPVPMKRVAIVSRSLDPFSLPAAGLVPISLRFHC